MSTVPEPTPGRIVLYQTDGRNYDYFLPALITITRQNLVPEAVAAGVIPDLSSDLHVHLWVPGGKAPYYEYDVPFDGRVFQMANEEWRRRRRTWRWPQMSRGVIETDLTGVVLA